jgi:hypothetical protein
MEGEVGSLTLTVSESRLPSLLCLGHAVLAATALRAKNIYLKLTLTGSITVDPDHRFRGWHPYLEPTMIILQSTVIRISSWPAEMKLDSIYASYRK